MDWNAEEIENPLSKAPLRHLLSGEQSFSISNTQGKIQQIERLEINAALDIVHSLACRAWDNKPSSSGRLSST